MRSYKDDRAKLLVKIKELENRNQKLEREVRHLKPEPSYLKKVVERIQVSHQPEHSQQHSRTHDPAQYNMEPKFSSESDD